MARKPSHHQPARTLRLWIVLSLAQLPFHWHSLLCRLPLLLFLTLGNLICHPAISRAEAAEEHQAKATFIYHFANFVDWPASTFAATKGHLRICVMGKDPFGQTLEASLAKKSLHNHPFEIYRNPPTIQLKLCHVLYFPLSASSKIRALRQHVEKEDVLTVGEASDFMEQGGMVQFFVEKQKVHFAVNTDVIDHTNLKVSSKLLRLAKIYTP